MRKKNRNYCVDPGIALWVALAGVAFVMWGPVSIPCRNVLLVVLAILYFTNLLVYGVKQYTLRINKKYMDMQLQLQKENTDKEYFRLLAKQSEEQKILIHDIKKHMNTLYLLLDDENVTDAKQYILNLSSAMESKKRIDTCDNAALNTIFAHYKNICEAENIKLEIDVRKHTLEDMHFEDITAMFGNMLENAIDACKGILNAYIDLSVQKTEWNSTLVTMVNTCKRQPRRRPDGTFLSSKEDGEKHGLGMKSIEKIARKYKGDLKVYYCATDNTFHTVIHMQCERRV